MRAITVWRPWGLWIAEGLKTIETRGHDRFRCLEGERIAIHEGKHFDKEAVEVAAIALAETSDPSDALRMFGVLDSWARASQRSGGGLIVCTAFVASADWMDGSETQEALCPTYPDRFGLWLTDIRKLDKPIPRRGKQGIWSVTELIEL